MLDVMTVGSAVLDIFIKSRDFRIDRHKEGVYLCEKYQGKIEAQELVMVSGGGGTNNAASFARKGFKVAPIIEVGRDPAAEMILLDLAREKVDLSLVVQEPDEVTAVSVILLSGQGGGSIITHRGASRMLTVEDIPFDKLGMQLKPNGWIHLTSVGGEMKLVKKLLIWAKEKNRKVFWNPGAAELEKISNYRLLITNYQINVFQLNKAEAKQFKGIKIPPETIFIVTDGKNGGQVRYQSKTFPYCAARTQTIDSTGAGDAFGSGLVAALMAGGDVKEAIEWGRKQAANVVGYIGAKEGLLSLNQLKK